MISQLIQSIILNNDRLPYIHLNKFNQYLGWTYDFGIVLPYGEKMKLNLNNENDLFLLFVLAASWSKTGPWENAVFFTAYLKAKRLDDYKLWLNDKFVLTESNNRSDESKHMVDRCWGLKSRKKVSFRSDFYKSTVVISENWVEIKRILEESYRKNNFMIFVDFISQLSGLGQGNNKMKIKIPLILRELRCQHVYMNIPGQLCCVTDNRVREAAKALNIKLPASSSLNNLLKSSQTIYSIFGDLYDIPLFAYSDVIKHNNLL